MSEEDKTLTNGAPYADHDDKGREYECLYCDTNFSRQATLVWHLRTVHNHELDIKAKSCPSGCEHNYHKRPTCSKCSAELRNAYELEEHTCGSLEQEESTVEHSAQEGKAVESPPTKPSKGKKRKPPATNIAKEPIASPVTRCSMCKKDFASEVLYHEHLSKYVTKHRPFFCCICETTFARKRSLVFHLYIHKRSSEPESKVSSLSDIDAPPRAYPYVPLAKTKIEEVETDEPPKKLGNIAPKTKKKTPSKTLPNKTPPSKTMPSKTPPSKTMPSKIPPSKTMPSKTPPSKTSPKVKPQVIDVRNNTVNNQKCSMCFKRFKKVLELEMHMINGHQSPLTHTCSLCPEAFALKASLLNHAIGHIF